MNLLGINTQRMIIIAILIPFTTFSTFAFLSINSFSELWSAFTSYKMIEQVTLDFLICFSIVSIWVWKDAKSKGVMPAPYMILMWCTGSIGLLIYMFRHIFNTDNSDTNKDRIDKEGHIAG